MKYRQLTLILLLVVGIMLFFTRPWWLPPLLVWLPFLEQRADLIQSLEAIISILVLGSNVVVGYLIWLSNRPSPTPQDDQFEPLEPITPQTIQEGLGRSGQVRWVDRGATSPSQLRQHGRLVIRGRSRLGKTREAAELIRQAAAAEIFLPNRIYRPSHLLYSLAEASLEAAIQRQIDPTQALLLFIDDFPFHVHGEKLAKLSTALKTLSACKALYVIATARSDQLTADHEKWLAEHHFTLLDLPDLNDEQINQIVQNGTQQYNLTIDDQARQTFVERNNGTPELPLMTLRRLRAENITNIQSSDAQRILHGSIADIWAEARRYILEQVPAAEFVLDALAHFYIAGLPRSRFLVPPYAGRLWQHQQPSLFFWSQRAELAKALHYLANFDIIIQDDDILHPDEIAERIIDAKTARKNVGDFLRSYRRLWHNRWLRRFWSGAEAQRSTLFELGLVCIGQQEFTDALDYFSVALHLDPSYGSYNNRGSTYAHLQDYDLALKDYSKAIALNPDDALAYNNRGLTYGHLQLYDQALKDFNKAIELNPDADAYNNRGLTYANLQQYDQALMDYNKAIELNPDYATAHYNRGLTYGHLQLYDQALKDSNKAIELNPDYAAAYNNRGVTYYHLQLYDQALTDFNKAIELNPDADAYNNPGLTYANLQQYDQALTDYAKAIELNPNYDAVYYYIACVYALQSQLDALIPPLRRAFELNRDHYLNLIQTDSDFDAVRQDPRFQDLLDEFSAKQ